MNTAETRNLRPVIASLWLEFKGFLHHSHRSTFEGSNLSTLYLVYRNSCLFLQCPRDRRFLTKSLVSEFFYLKVCLSYSSIFTKDYLKSKVLSPYFNRFGPNKFAFYCGKVGKIKCL